MSAPTKPPEVPLAVLHAQLNRTVLSSEDVREARGYFAALATELPEVARRGLMTAAIVAYARPFVGVRSGSAVQEATSQLKVKLQDVFTAEDIGQHHQLLALRQKVVAHTDYGVKPVRRYEGTRHQFSMDLHHFELLDQGVDPVRSARMCSKLEAHCFTQCLGLNEAIVRAVAVSNTPAAPPTIGSESSGEAP